VDRRTRNLFAIVLVAVIALSGGAALILGGGSSPTPAATPPAATPPAGTPEVVGVIVAVDSQGLGDVRGFTLRRSGGEELGFSLAALENGIQFPPGHLAEHLADAVPVRVWYRESGGERLALWLEDAPP
jgi:hypothetical protein